MKTLTEQVEIVRATCADVFGVTVADMMGPHRVAQVALARQVGMVLAHDLVLRNATQAGAWFNRSRVNVIISRTTIANRRATEPSFAALYELARDTVARRIA